MPDDIERYKDSPFHEGLKRTRAKEQRSKRLGLPHHKMVPCGFTEKEVQLIWKISQLLKPGFDPPALEMLE